MKSTGIVVPPVPLQSNQRELGWCCAGADAATAAFTRLRYKGWHIRFNLQKLSFVLIFQKKKSRSKRDTNVITQLLYAAASVSRKPSHHCCTETTLFYIKPTLLLPVFFFLVNYSWEDNVKWIWFCNLCLCVCVFSLSSTSLFFSIIRLVSLVFYFSSYLPTAKPLAEFTYKTHHTPSAVFNSLSFSFFFSSVFSSLPFFLYWPFFPLLIIYTISFRHDCRHFRATTHPALVLCRRVVLLQYRNFVFSPRSLPFLFFFLSFSPLPTLTTLWLRLWH